MSRRASSSAMGPPADRDVVMAPPQFPQQQYQPQHNNSAPKPTVDVNEKYKKLKRKYFDLEEV